MNRIDKACVRACGAWAVAMWLIALSGCSVLPKDMFRDNTADNVIENERYDPETGEPLIQGKIIDPRPIKVLQRLPDGKGGKKAVVREIKITGGHYLPPPLPKKVNPADAGTLDTYSKEWREGKAETVPVK